MRVYQRPTVEIDATLRVAARDVVAADRDHPADELGMLRTELRIDPAGCAAKQDDRSSNDGRVGVDANAVPLDEGGTHVQSVMVTVRPEAPHAVLAPIAARARQTRRTCTPGFCQRPSSCLCTWAGIGVPSTSP